MNETVQNLMREATRLTQSGRLIEATEAIQRALSGAQGADAEPCRTNAHDAAARVRATDAVPSKASSLVLDGCVFEVDAGMPAAKPTTFSDAPAARPTVDALPPRLRSVGDDAAATIPVGLGEFTSGTHTHATQTRRYKLYAPPGHIGRQLPLVVMLHGCTQDPDDFAAGTGMNERAREQGFFVLYPAQSQDANPSRCWNWFTHPHHPRDSGEPALIAGMMQAVMKQYGIDARSVYIAGLSAGGAMAAIVAAAYPEIFAAVGVHSGLPCGAASDMAGALAMMKSGRAGPTLRARESRVGTAPASRPQMRVPTIVFHGDQDRTVHPRNGELVIAAVLDRHAAADADESQALPPGSP